MPGFHCGVSMKKAFQRVGADWNTISRTSPIAVLALASPEVFWALPQWDEMRNVKNRPNESICRVVTNITLVGQMCSLALFAEFHDSMRHLVGVDILLHLCSLKTLMLLSVIHCLITYTVIWNFDIPNSSYVKGWGISFCFNSLCIEQWIIYCANKKILNFLGILASQSYRVGTLA